MKKGKIQKKKEKREVSLRKVKLNEENSYTQQKY
jgi:hypothetical protein